MRAHAAESFDPVIRGECSQTPAALSSRPQGHPAGDGERSDRDVGGPTSPEDAPDEDVSGGAPGTRETGIESHE
jgi:hypothetical protein